MSWSCDDYLQAGLGRHHEIPYTFVSHQQEVGADKFDDVTTLIQGGQSSVKALTGSTEEEQLK